MFRGKYRPSKATSGTSEPEVRKGQVRSGIFDAIGPIQYRQYDTVVSIDSLHYAITCSTYNQDGQNNNNMTLVDIYDVLEETPKHGHGT